MKHALKIFMLAMVAYLAAGCAAYEKTPWYFPNGYEAEVSTDKTGLTTFYLGVTGPLKKSAQ